MVLGVCRRLLCSRQDAEDAFQVTFLILARKAGSIREPALLANWLYGVAYRVASKARAIESRRRVMLNRIILMRTAKADRQAPASELEAALDREIHRLPPQYRAAIVACYLEGKSNRQAARDLGWPEGTLVTRLNRAKQLLRRRMSEDGKVLSASVPGGTLRRRHPAPALDPALLIAITNSAAAFARGANMTTLLSSRAATLLRPALRSAMSAKAKVIAAFVVGVAGAAAVVAARYTVPGFHTPQRHALIDSHPDLGPAALAAGRNEGDDDADSPTAAPAYDSTLSGPVWQAHQTMTAATHADYGVSKPVKR